MIQLNELENEVRRRFEGEGSGHDWWHIHRVRNNALALAKAEGADLRLTEAAALLHDIADHKFHGNDLTVGPKTAIELAIQFGADQLFAERIGTIVSEVSYKGAGVDTPVSSIEAACVQDADRLDAIGAIGIARAFAYGGSKGRLLYHPDHPPKLHDDFKSYATDQGHTVNHFYEKLLLLKDRMQTASGKKAAAERHSIMEDFLKSFYAEWDGKDSVS